MSLVNIYIKETPLTSTRNKFLEHSLFIDSLGRLEESEPLRKKPKHEVISPKCLTENKILLENQFNVWKDDVSKKKKKKAKRYRKSAPPVVYFSAPISESSSASRECDDIDGASRECDDTDDAVFSTAILSEGRKISEQLLEAKQIFGAGRAQDLQMKIPVGGSVQNRCFVQSAKLAAPSFAFGNAPGQSFTLEEASAQSFTLGEKSAQFLAFGSAQGFGFRSAPARSVALRRAQASIPETFISKMPTYELEVLKLSEEMECEFFSLDANAFYQSENYISSLKGKKMQLLNVVSMALMYSPNLKNEGDYYRETLEKSANDVRFFDPEFILKVALYARQELHIRTVTNFLLSYAALHENTRLYLEKYFETSIVLPSDWIQVAEYYQVLSSGTSKKSFPAALRRVMKKTFSKFDQYQLAKYNRDKLKKKKIKKKEDSEVEAEEKDEDKIKTDVVENENFLDFEFDEADEDESKDEENKNENLEITVKKHTSFFTLKKLIRILHVDSPTEHIMCLLGKKYPHNLGAFKLSGLPGTWDSSKAGTRMKLPIPETWETQLSLHGNVPFAWELLIDNNRLPYMATLRNLKNLILSGISPAHHKKVIRHLENKKAVINSRQLPMQYFEAYKVISHLENMFENKTASSVDLKAMKMPVWKKNQFQKTKERLNNASISLIKLYKYAISNALEISSLNNLHPVPGKTVVICAIESTESSSINKLKTYETCIMMGLMCLKACEDCKMNILCLSHSPDIILMNENDMLLDVMMKTCERYEKLLTDSKHLAWEDPDCSFKKVLDFYLRPQTILSLKLDHIILLQSSSASFKDVMSSFLHKYRQIVNSNLLYTNVNFSIKSQRFNESCFSEKDVYLCGSSSSLIKFIAERSSGGQLMYIENIDMKHNLPKISESKKFVCNTNNSTLNTLPDTATPILVNCKIPKWHTVRIFISSTFKDMMSERDLLIRYVFPELRRRAASVFVRIVEVDLRWGITEADSATKRAAELCLLEAQKADLFVGLIGDRYGTIYDFDLPDTPELQWIEDCSDELSITDLEVHAAAFRDPESSKKKAFFYFRDNSFLSHVPQKWRSHFDSEDLSSKTKVEALKNKIKASNFKILERYPCHWAGVYEDKPILSGLGVLGKRVLEDLWQAVQDTHKRDPYCDNIEEEEMYQQNLIDSQHFYVGEKNSPMESIIKRIKFEHGIFAICGCSGSGKTAFAIKLLQHLKNYAVVKFFIGVSPRSRDLSYMLQSICNSICCQLSISIPIPDLPDDIVNQFPDILLEAANCSGGRELILIIDGLDHLDKEDQRLDWLPLSLPYGVKLICLVSELSEAFKFLHYRQLSGSAIFIENLPSLLQSDREKFIRSYLSYYSKSVDESAFRNHMLKIVTKKDSSNPFYLRIICDFLRIYATFDNLVPMLQKLPSSITPLCQEIILQMENEFGSNLIQSVLTLLCITKEGLEDNDLHFILSFVIHMNEMKASPTFNELREKLQLLEPEHLLCQVKYCSLMYVISTFAYGTIMGPKSFNLVGTEFEDAVKRFYLNKNYVSHSIYLHSVLAGYYYNMCDLNKDGRYSGQSGFAIRSLLYHMFYGNLYKELNDLLCCHRFLEAAFRTNVGAQLLEYYSSLLYDILPTNQKISREIDSYHLFSFYDFVSRNFHIFHRYPQLVMQQALNEPSNSVVSLKSEDCNHHFLENLSRSHIVDSRLTTFSGFVKNITASAGEKKKPIVALGSEDGYLKILDLGTRKVVRSIKGHLSAITCICFVGKNRMCASSIDGTLSLWDSVDFSRVAVLSGHRHNVTSCCADPSGSILFSSGWDNSVRLWSLVDGRSISIIDDFRCPVNCIDHHPLKQQIACGLWSGNIEIWDTVSMKRTLVFTNFSGSVKSLAFTPDGVNIISSFIESEISIWSSEEGLKILSLQGHVLPVKTLSFSFDHSVFVSGSDDCTLKVWSSVHGSHFSSISDCKFCPINFMNFLSENLLAVAFQNSEIWIFDINSGKATCKIMLTSDFVSVFSKYTFINVTSQSLENTFIEKSVVFGTQAGKLMIGDLLTSSISVRFEMNSKITAVIHNSDTMICGTAEGDIGVFSYPDEMLSKTIFGAHRGFVATFSFALKCEELILLSTANDNVLKLWKIDRSISDVIFQQELLNHHKDCITYSVFYPYSCDASLLDNLLTGSHDNNVISWNEGSIKVFQGLHSSIVNIARSGDYILACGNDGAVVMWSLKGKTLTSIPRIELSSATMAFFVAENDFDKFTVILAFVDQDGSIKINKPLQKTFSCSFEGHSKPVTSCCTTENGDVISCSLDGSVNLWKVPVDNPDVRVMHSSAVTGIIVSSALEYAVTSDAHGNLILWKIDVSSSLPLTYVGIKSYVGGFIRALSWLKDNNFVCAVNQIALSGEESYFIHVINLKYSFGKETSAHSFQIKNSFHFKSEILCLHSCSNTDLIVVGLKSGDAVIIKSGVLKSLKISNDWILGVQLFTRTEKSDLFCTSLVDGSIKLYHVKDFISAESESPLTPFGVYKPPADSHGSKLISSLCSSEDRLICCGDSEGVLRIYSHNCLKFNEKVHNDVISGTCIAGSYLFTSSFDKSVKGWDLKSFKQVCQFHSSVPISCLASPQISGDACDKNSCLLLIGTTSGNVHILKFHGY